MAERKKTAHTNEVGASGAEYKEFPFGYGLGESGIFGTPLLGRGESGMLGTPLFGRGESGMFGTPLFGRGESGIFGTPLA